MEFARDEASARVAAAFDHDDAQAGAAEENCRSQTLRAGADDRRVVTQPVTSLCPTTIVCVQATMPPQRCRVLGYRPKKRAETALRAISALG